MFFRSQRKQQAEVSINEAIDYDREGNPLTYIDVISCEDDMAGDLDARLSSERLRGLIDTALPERERTIIKMRYGIGGGRAMTQRETADKLGISRSYVSRIERSALDRLRSFFAHG